MNRNVSASLFGTSCRNQHVNGGEVEVPVEKGVSRVLLVVQRDRERNRLLHDIRRRGVTQHVAIVDHLADGSSRSEATAGIVSELVEILSPNFHERASVLGTVARVEGENTGRFVVSELNAIALQISEVASQSHSHCRSLKSFVDLYVVVALKTGVRTVIVACFRLVD